MKTIVVCFSLLHVIQCLYSTKTHYYDSFTQEQLDYLNDETNYVIDNCTVQQLYMIVRHGARYPSGKQAKRSIEFLRDLRDNSKRNDDAELLNSINETVFENTPHYGLTNIGALEMKQIGERFRKRYFKDLIRDAELSDVSFMSSSKSRSIESGTNFTHGLFTSNFDQELLKSSMQIDDEMLRGFDKCKVYVKKIKENLGAYNEYTLFKEEKVVRNMIDEFKKRHFINDHYNVDIEDLFIVGTICDIEYAHRMPDNWCKLLTDDDRKILGYFNDLKNYWIKAHGNKLNAYATCFIIKDWVDEIEKFISNDPNRKKILLRFGHAENIFPLISNLDLFKDDDAVRSDNYHATTRLFKTFVIAPFSSNIASVLLKCGGEYKIKLLINELPIGVINSGKLKCAREHDSICNHDDFKQSLLSHNQMCFTRNFCDTIDNEEL